MLGVTEIDTLIVLLVDILPLFDIEAVLLNDGVLELDAECVIELVCETEFVADAVADKERDSLMDADCEGVAVLVLDEVLVDEADRVLVSDILSLTEELLLIVTLSEIVCD